MDSNGNLIDPDTGEVIAPSETETGTDMPVQESFSSPLDRLLHFWH